MEINSDWVQYGRILGRLQQAVLGCWNSVRHRQRRTQGLDYRRCIKKKAEAERYPRKNGQQFSQNR